MDSTPWGRRMGRELSIPDLFYRFLSPIMSSMIKCCGQLRFASPLVLPGGRRPAA